MAWRRGPEDTCVCEVCGEVIGCYNDMGPGFIPVPALWHTHEPCPNLEAERLRADARAERRVLVASVDTKARRR